MPAPRDDSAAREQRLNAILHDYLQAVDAGRPPGKEEVLRLHPDLADELAAFFADQERMDRLAGDMRMTEPAESPDAAPPIRYVGDYELLEEIARGGMGVVFKARQVSLNRLVAVKMILSGRLAEPAEVERFRREAGAAAQLDHPNIVPIYEVGEHQGHHYYSMKLIESDNLGVEMPHFTANHSAAALLLAKVARAVQHAHEHGILHRDIKPGNILLDAAKQPHVTDFGLARRLDESSSLSASGAVIGTVSYMAPEQAAAQCRRLTAAADVYALGAVLYEMLTGRPPFKNANVVQTLRDVVEREPERPRKLNRRVSHDLEVICLKCLDKRPHRRYATAAALADDLERCVVGRPIQGRIVGRPERLWLWCRRQPVAVALAAAVFLVVALSVGAVVVWRQGVADIEQAQKKAKADGDAALLQDADDRDNLRYLRLIGEASARLREGDLETAKRRLDECALPSRLIEWRYLYARITEPAFFGGFPKETPNPNIPGPGPLQIRQVAFTADSSRVVILEDDELTVLSTSDQILEDRQAHVLTNPDDRHVVKSFKSSIGDIPLKSITAMSIDGDGSHVGLASVQPWDNISPRIETVGVWSLQTGAEVFRLSDVGGVREVALSPDGRRFAAYAHEKTTVWDTSDGKSLFSFPRASSITFSPDSSRFAYIDEGSRLTVRDATTGKELFSVTDKEGTFRYSADGRRILCFSDDRASMMDAGTGEVLFRVPMDVRASAITPDGKRLLVLGQSSGRRFSANPGPGPVGVESLRPDEDFTLWVGDALTGQEIANIPIPVQDRGARNCRSAISPDGEHIGVFFRDAAPWWFEPFQRRHILTMSGERGPSAISDPLYKFQSQYALTLSPDGRLIAATGGDGRDNRLAVFDAVTLKRIRWLAGDWPGEWTSRMAFSPDGRTLAAGSYGGVLKWWNVATGEEIHTIQGHPKPYDIESGQGRDSYPSPPAIDLTLSFSPDGRRLASAWADNVVTVMDVATGAEVFRLPHSGPVSGVLFRPDGQRILSCEPGKLREWDAASGAPIRESEIKITNEWAYHCVALCYRGDSPCVVENKYQMGDGMMVWDAETGRVIFLVKGEPCMTAVTPDGKRLATCDDFHGMVHVWDVSTGRELLSFSPASAESPLAFRGGRGNGFFPINYKVLLSADGNRLFHCVWGLTVWDVSTTP